MMATRTKSSEKKIVSLTVIGRDRTGVIAAFTNILFHLGANIEALAEEVRRGQFSMTLQASWQAVRFDEPKVRAEIQKLGAQLKMDASLRVLSANRRQRLALFVTRETHCFEGLLKAKLPCTPAVVIGNRPDLAPLAKKHGLPFHHLPWTDVQKTGEDLKQILNENEVDFIVLARFMRILSPSFVWRWKNKIINIHPSLLPAFPGASAYRQAFEKGVRVVGVTAHIVTPDLDQGPILDQAAFRVGPKWTLPEIVAAGQKQETKVLISAVRLFLQHRFDIYWGRVHRQN